MRATITVFRIGGGARWTQFEVTSPTELADKLWAWMAQPGTSAIHVRDEDGDPEGSTVVEWRR